jgi:hypothetical protein
MNISIIFVYHMCRLENDLLTQDANASHHKKQKKDIKKQTIHGVVYLIHSTEILFSFFWGTSAYHPSTVHQIQTK